MDNQDKYQNVFISTTDTVVGIGTPVKNGNLELIYELKERPQDKKVIILVSSLAQAREFKEWNVDAEKLAKEKWPGAVSIIVNNQGFRMPNHPGLLKLINEVGPIYMSSANKSGNAPINIKESNKIFPEIKRVYNFGEGSNNPSEIIRVEDGKKLR